MKKKKTVIEYLQEIPQEMVRTRALANTGAADGREWAPCLSVALKHAFIWFRSPEGFGYWCDVYLEICRSEQNGSSIIEAMETLKIFNHSLKKQSTAL